MDGEVPGSGTLLDLWLVQARTLAGAKQGPLLWPMSSRASPIGSRSCSLGATRCIGSPTATRLCDRIEAVVREHSWNFADFTTATSGIHAGWWKQEGCLPRDRQPKAAAQALRHRWREDV